MAKKIFAETFGTFVLVLMGTATALFTGNILATALAFGIAVVMMAYALGGHFNPAVSLAMLVKKEINVVEFITYFLSQIIGALVASLLLFVLLGGATTGLGANVVNPVFAEKAVVVGLVIEVVLTFIFVYVITLLTKKENNGLNGLLIGLALVGLVITGFSFTGASLNPARSLAPAIFAGGEPLKQVWIFIVAPLVGGGLAGLVSHLVDNE